MSSLWLSGAASALAFLVSFDTLKLLQKVQVRVSECDAETTKVACCSQDRGVAIRNQGARIIAITAIVVSVYGAALQHGRKKLHCQLIAHCKGQRP